MSDAGFILYACELTGARLTKTFPKIKKGLNFVFTWVLFAKVFLVKLLNNRYD